MRPRPERTFEMNVDRPFFFVIRDEQTGALLFLGRVTDPTR
jgi:serine protease inhibitor